MTIIQPNKSKFSFNILIVFICGFLASLVYLNIYFYNENVGLGYEISAQSKNLQQLQVINGESKNQLYKITDLNNLDSLIKSRNLIKEVKPEYLENKSVTLATN